MQDLMNTPVNDPNVANSQVLSNLVQVTPVVRPQWSRTTTYWPVIDVYASTQDRDLGGVIRDVNKCCSHSASNCRAVPSSSSAARW